jgi:hypothetical protein
VSRRLFIGPVSSDFDAANDVAAGPWCFAGREDVCAEWETLPFVEPFDTPAKLVEAERITAGLVDALAISWGARLNERHGLERPVAFWHRYLLLWLSLATMGTWARWRNAVELITRYGGESLDVITLNPSNPFSFPDFPAFTSRLLADPQFQWWMDSEIVRRLAPSNWRLIDAGAAEPNPIATVPPQPPSRIGTLARTLLPRLHVDHLPGLAASKVAYSALAAMLPRRPAAATKHADGGRTAFPSDYLAFLDEFLALCVPDTFAGAGFAPLDEEARKLRYRPGCLYIANTRAFSDRERLVSAHALVAGERLVNAQHGGWEGTAACVSWGRHAYGEDHAFLTWGWNAQAGLAGRFVPFTSPQLSKLRNRHRCRDRSLVLVGSRLAANGMRFDCVPRPRAMVEYRITKLQFLSALQPEVLDAARYRPYTRDISDFADGSYVQGRFPQVPIVAGDFHEAMLRCRLLVVDHPGSTMHVAVAANVPMICFWRTDDWALCDEAKPYFDELRAAGVLFNNPVSAARRVNEIWADVAGWWSSGNVVDAVRNWRHRFAHTGRFAHLKLIGTLWQLSRLGADQARTAMPIPKGRWYAAQTNSRVSH